MKRILLSLLFGVFLLFTIGCSSKNIESSTLDNSKVENNDAERVNNLVQATINGKEYIIHLEDNNSAQAFLNLLPQSFNMSELNGNEKYVYLENTLPSNPSNPKKINAGDVMLYGNNCLVIFYKSFDTTYNYTKIGHIDNLADLGKENIMVLFTK